MLRTPTRRLLLGVATVTLAVPSALLFASPVAASGAAVALATPDTEPPAEQPPDTTAEQAPSDTTAEQAPSDGGDDDNGWLLFVALLAVLVAGVALVLSLLSRGGRSSTATGRAGGADAYREQSNIMGTAQWFHDQLSVQLMGSPPDQALTRWQYERPRVQSIAAAANQQAGGADDPWHLLANSVLLLSGSIDTLLGLQVQQPRNDDGVQEATTVANARRRQLQALLVTMWPMVQTS